MKRITLDNTGYEELLEKAVSRIPELCPDWKSTRQSDPGITLIQLMAALTDIQNYTVDSVNEQHKEEYIKLLGGKKRNLKCARAAVDFGSESDVKLIKGDRIKIGRKFFEYSGVEHPNGKLFIQKETLIQSIDFNCDDNHQNENDSFIFPLWWIAFDGTIKVFKQTGDNIWQPVESEHNYLSIKTDRLDNGGRYRAVFYDKKNICDYYKKSDIACRENGVLEFGETSGVTMQKIEVFAPKFNGIMPGTFKLWVNYGSYYEEIGFNPIENGSITLGSGRDFPILKGGGKIEAFSLILTKGATSLSEKQSVFYKSGGEKPDKNDKIKTAVITVLSEGRNAETIDEALLRIDEMLTPKTRVTADDYAQKIKELYGNEIKKLKVISSAEFNKIIVYVLLNDTQKQFPKWRTELLKKLQPHKLLTVSIEVHEVMPVYVIVKGEIALNAGCCVEIQEEIKRAVEELCESEIGSPLKSHTLTENLLMLPHVKQINRLIMKYDREIKDVEKTLTILDKDRFSINFIFS